jgi:hypothetical protein
MKYLVCKQELLFKYIYYLIPGKIEHLLKVSASHNEFRFYDLLLGIRNRRNLIYFTTGTGIVFLFCGYNIIACICFIFHYVFSSSYAKYISLYKNYI